MKKIFLLFSLIALCFSFQTQAQTVKINREIPISRLDKDFVLKFNYEYQVKYTSSFDEEKQRWKVVVEEVFPPQMKDVNKITYWLKLDADCKPEKNSLDKFKICGFNLTIKLIKTE